MADAMPQQPPAPPTPPAAAPAPAQPPKPGDKDVEDNKVMAALSYLGILFLVPLLAAKNSKFAQFHAKQGMVMFVVDVVVSMVVWVPIVGQLLGLALLVVNVYAMYQAFQGNWWELPYLGQYAKKINL